jgi:RHS repeat-associated protein
MIRRPSFNWFWRPFITLCLLGLIIQPLLAQEPGYLPPADPEAHLDQDYQDDGRGPFMPTEWDVGPSKKPSFTLPEQANQVAELIPPHLPGLAAVYDAVQQRETAAVDRQGAAVSFLDGRVTIIADADTFLEPVTLALKPLFALPEAQAGEAAFNDEEEVPQAGVSEAAVPQEDEPDPTAENDPEAVLPEDTMAPAVGEGEEAVDGIEPLPEPHPYPYEWLQFEIEALRLSDGQPVPIFDKEVYMVVDLREMLADVAGPGWFLAFQDETDPILWHSAPITLHDETGLFSATTDHFSTWHAGYEPAAWRYQWSVPAVSEFTGAATFHYPIAVPPGRGGLAPNIDISYSSRGADTLIFSDGHEQVPLGLGWNIDNIEITRDDIHARDDGAHVFMQHPNRFSLVFNGNRYELRLLNISGSTANYYAVNSPGLKVQQIHDNNAGNPNKLYWRVTAANGTVYRLGYTANAESHQHGFIDTWPGQLTGAGSSRRGIRWRVDMVTDVHGNQIQFTYVTTPGETEHYQSNSGTWTWVTTTASRIREIRYNYVNRAAGANSNTPVSGTYASRILFEPAHYSRVSEIKLYQVDLSMPYRVVKIGLGVFTPSNNHCGQGHRKSHTHAVTSIRQETADGTLFLPATTFTYWEESNVPINGYECYRFSRLREVNNGYGGKVRFNYTSDGRVHEGWHWTWHPPSYGRTLFVNKVEIWDGVNANAAVIEYQYQTPCYDQYEGSLGNQPGAFNCPAGDSFHPYPKGKLIGFAQTLAIYKDYNGQIWRRTVTNFDQSRLRRGWPRWHEVRDGGNFRLQRRETTYSRDAGSANGRTWDFSFASKVCATDYMRGGQNSQHCVHYEYGRQNSVQYGNLTAIREYGYLGGVGNNERHILRDYYSNTSAWIVGTVARERTLGPGSSLQAETRHFYDDQTNWAVPPLKGNLTRVNRLKELPSSYMNTQILVYDLYGNVTTARDGRNNPTTIEYDATFKLLPVRITNAATHVQQLEYFGFNGVPRDGNQAGLLKRVIDANNAITSYGYDPFGRLTRVIRPFDSWNSPSEFYSYHDYGSNRLTAGPFLIGTWRKTQNNAGTYTTGGVFERNFYDGFGRLVQVQRPYTNWGGSGVGQEVVVDMGYNAAGQMVRQSRPYLRAAYTYGTVNGLVINPYHPPDTNQPRVTHAYDALGQTVRSVNLDGGVTSGIYGLRSAYTQDANNNIRAAYTDMVGQLVAVDEMTNRFSDTFDNANLPGWNKAGNVSVTGGVVRLAGDGTWGTNIRRNLQTTGEDGVTFSFRTNSVNNVATMFLHQGSWGNSNYRRWAIMLSGGQIIKQEYSGTTLTSDTLMPLKANTWYRAALITSRSNVNHRLVVWEENNPANFAEVRLPKDNSWKQHGWQFMVQMNTSGATLDLDNYAEFDFYRTRYEYDLSGNLRKVTNPLGHVTEMWYDALGRKTSMRDPDMSNPANSGSRWWYSYDNAGNLTQQTDAKGQVIAFVYDNLNRLTEKKQGSTVLAVYGYDAGSNGKGRRTSMTAYVGETNSASWTYDARGRVTNEYRTVAGSSYRFHFTYTQGDLPLTIRYPAGPGNQLGETVTTHYYWPTGQPRRLVGDSVYVDETTYREFGAPSQVNLGSNIVNIYGYDAAMRTNHIRYHVGGSNRFRLGLNYDKVGNVMSVQDYTPPGGGSTQWQYFTYDSLNRLTSAYTTGGNAGDYNQTYAYDPLGNFTQKAGLTMGYGQANGIAANARPHAVTHLNGSQKYWYDHNGNMTYREDESGLYTQTFNVENRLTNVSNEYTGDDVRFVYDADGVMVLRNDNGQRTVFLGNLYQRNLSTGAQTRHYFFGGKLVAVNDGSLSFLLTDHLGSVNVTLNADGTIRSRLRYDPWGKQRYAQNNTPTDYRYTAQRFDAKLGIYDYRARYYDPHIARFLSADPIVPDPKNPQQFNRYSYVLNNPMTHT